MRTGLIIFISIISALFLLPFIIVQQPAQINGKKRVGLLVMATGNYVRFVDALLDSTDKYFCKNHEVTYFVFTDGDLSARDNLVIVSQAQLGWPYDTMMRFAVYHTHKDQFADFDYLFSCDADMLFVDHVGAEMFGDRVGTLQPNYLFDAKPYERNPLSTACINRGEGSHYFAGGFYGASRDEFIKLTKNITDNICIDLARGFIAINNDESHLNRYFVDHKPSVILSPSYCHFENWRSPYPKKLVALVKSVTESNTIRKKATFNPIDYYKKFVLDVT